MTTRGKWLLIALAVACGKRTEKPSVADAAPKPKPSIATADPAMMQPAPRVNASAPAGDVAPSIRPISDDAIMVGDVLANLTAKRIEIPARIALREGILEFLAVSPRGRAYESALVVDAHPFHVQTALLIAGFKQGDALAITMRTETGEERPIASLLVDRSTGKPSAHAWRFTGSRVEGGRFFADETGSVIAIWPDATAVVNDAFERGNPYRGAAQGVAIAPSVPPVGTKLTILIGADPAVKP